MVWLPVKNGFTLGIFLNLVIMNFWKPNKMWIVKFFNSLLLSKPETNPKCHKNVSIVVLLLKSKNELLTCPAVKMATFLSFWPRKAMLLVGKLFSCSAFPVARSKIQYRTQVPVFKTACTPSGNIKAKKNLYIFNDFY